MARSISVIKQQILDAKAAQPELSGANSASNVALFKLWAYIQAVAINLFEQLLDQFVKDIEATIVSAPPGSEPWVQSKVFEFQYDATTPQVLDIVNYVPAYNPIDHSKRIITRCSVKTAANRTCYVKVAKSDPPIALASLEKSALQAYLSGGGNGTYSGRGRGFGFAGINYVVQSFSPDLLWLQGTIYYNGLYSSVIQSNVIAAIKGYMSNLPFDGTFTLLGLTDAIQSVTGVNDIDLTDIAIRAYSTSFGGRTYLVQANTILITSYPTYAGYVVEETTSGEDFASKLTFTAS